MCDWDVTKRDKASMVEKPPEGFKLLIESIVISDRNYYLDSTLWFFFNHMQLTIHNSRCHMLHNMKHSLFWKHKQIHSY